MSRSIRLLTGALLMLPIGFVVAASLGAEPLALVALLLVAMYAWVWLRFRPGRFVVRPDAIEVVWPLKRREIPRTDVASARILDGAALREEIGWGLRVGAGGLFGGFGWLWTRRRGIVQLYVSRTDSFVWLERRIGRPWLITPERPGEFVRAVSPENG
jgi:uncharacterized membrane protein YfcA